MAIVSRIFEAAGFETIARGICGSIRRSKNFRRSNEVRNFGSQPLLSELTKEEVDHILRRHERTVFVGESAVHSFDSNQLPANSPCEDHYAYAKCASASSWFFGVFDGHGGSACSRTVARRLFDYTAISLLPLHLQKELAKAVENGTDILEWFSNNYTDREFDDIFLRGHLQNLQRFAAQCVSRHDSLANVRTAFQSAFVSLDDDLTKEAKSDTGGAPSVPHVSLVASGSCACVAQIRGPHLHVANVGDSAAVLAVCNEHGAWSARQITHEHTIDNADEVKRIRSEHPAKEATTILKAGRLLGQLFPLRAFGDVRFKWSKESLQNVLEPVVKAKVVPVGLETPPYLTAKPEVYYHRLTRNDKFLVIASDGLWEMISPDKVVRLISDHMIGRVTLSPYVPGEGAQVGQVLQDLQRRKVGESKKPLDVNAATHLIRFALGGSSNGNRQYAKLATLLGLRQGAARDYHDDITIAIIYFDPVYLAEEHTDPVASD